MDGLNYKKSTTPTRMPKVFLTRCLECARSRVNNNLHNKVESWLVHTFSLILLPIYVTPKKLMISVLRGKTYRAMQSWSHYSFKCKLVSHAQKFKDAIVRIVNEVYTSKKCETLSIRASGGPKVLPTMLAD